MINSLEKLACPSVAKSEGGKLSKIVANPLKFWGLAVAAFGGEMRSD